jgi:hypothetical protein
MPSKKTRSAIVPIDVVQQRILILREQRVIIDADIAQLYGVTTKRLNEAVKRNADRFPPDFMLQLTSEEASALRSQSATSNKRGGRRYLPYAFTEHGAIMAATVLNSERAVNASLFVVRAFVKLRELLTTHHQLADKLAELEGKCRIMMGRLLGLLMQFGS